MIGFLKEFIQYTRKPYFISETTSNGITLNRILHLLAIYFVFILIVGSILAFYNALLSHSIGIDFSLIRKQHIQEALSSSQINEYVLLILMGPLVEEFLFRGWLRMDRIFIAIFFFLATFILSSIVIANASFYEQVANPDFYVRLLVSLSMGTGLYFLIPGKAINKFKFRIFPYLFWSSSVLFGLIHLANFGTLQIGLLIYAIPFILPQFFLGLILAFIRIKYGFLWAVLLHMTVNLFSSVAI